MAVYGVSKPPAEGEQSFCATSRCTIGPVFLKRPSITPPAISPPKVVKSSKPTRPHSITSRFVLNVVPRSVAPAFTSSSPIDADASVTATRPLITTFVSAASTGFRCTSQFWLSDQVWPSPPPVHS